MKLSDLIKECAVLGCEIAHLKLSIGEIGEVHSWVVSVDSQFLCESGLWVACCNLPADYDIHSIAESKECKTILAALKNLKKILKRKHSVLLAKIK